MRLCSLWRHYEVVWIWNFKITVKRCKLWLHSEVELVWLYNMKWCRLVCAGLDKSVHNEVVETLSLIWHRLGCVIWSMMDYNILFYEGLHAVSVELGWWLAVGWCKHGYGGLKEEGRDLKLGGWYRLCGHLGCLSLCFSHWWDKGRQRGSSGGQGLVQWLYCERNNTVTWEECIWKDKGMVLTCCALERWRNTWRSNWLSDETVAGGMNIG